MSADSAMGIPLLLLSAQVRGLIKSHGIAVVRGRIEPPTFRFSGGRSYRLSYLTWLDTQ